MNISLEEKAKRVHEKMRPLVIAKGWDHRPWTEYRRDQQQILMDTISFYVDHPTLSAPGGYAERQRGSVERCWEGLDIIDRMLELRCRAEAHREL